MKKPKKPQSETPGKFQERDYFRSPKWISRVVSEFIPEGSTVWEFAEGDGRMTSVISEKFVCWGTDLFSQDPMRRVDFLKDPAPREFDVLVSNPWFSGKISVYKKCRAYGKPFALLLPSEDSIWLLDAVHVDGCERIKPRNRVNYITPNILDIVCRGETFMQYLPRDRKILFDNKPKNVAKDLWNYKFMFPSIDECPKELLAKWSASQFHSMWLTWGFNIGRMETLVPVTNEMMLDI